MLHLLLSHEVSPTEDFSSWAQMTAMLHLLGVNDAPDVHTALQNKLSQQDVEINDPCEWRGVTCWANIVVSIVYEGDALRPVPIVQAYEWLPPTVGFLQLANQRFKRPVDTKLLPRVLTTCSLRRCDIQGSFNVQNLPETVQTLDCSRNAITGAILLAKLPHTILSMDFSGNAISYVLVDNSALPPSLSKCDFTNMRDSVAIEAIGDDFVDRRIQRDVTFFDELKSRWDQKA